jgi:hypothetical protein
MMSAEPVERLKVQVTFLRMDAPPTNPAPALPGNVRVERVRHCSVPFYRYLYDTVGAPWLWWMRRIATDAELAGLLGHPSVSVHVLMRVQELVVLMQVLVPLLRLVLLLLLLLLLPLLQQLLLRVLSMA